MSLSVIEALACGKPCLLTREADPGGLVERHAAGEIVAGNPTSIAKGLQTIAALTEEQRKNWEKGEEAIIAGLNWEVSARQMVAAYHLHIGK